MLYWPFRSPLALQAGYRACSVPSGGRRHEADIAATWLAARSLERLTRFPSKKAKVRLSRKLIIIYHLSIYTLYVQRNNIKAFSFVKGCAVLQPLVGLSFAFPFFLDPQLWRVAGFPRISGRTPEGTEFSSFRLL